MKHHGFSLIELMVAAAVSAVLMGAVLLLLGSFARVQRRLTREDASPQHGALLELLRRDLANAQTMALAPDGRRLVLVGHGGIDPRSMSLTNRLTRVSYDIRGNAETSLLTREQEYLDDPIRRDRWTEVAARGVVRLAVERSGADLSAANETTSEPTGEDEGPSTGQGTRKNPSRVRIPAKVRLRVDWLLGPSIDSLLWLR